MACRGRPPSVLYDTRRTGPDGRPVGTLASIQKIEPSVVMLTYTIVTLEPTFKANDFELHVPANARVEDSTEQVLSELEQMIQATIAAKKAETARTEPLLPQTIEIPRTPPANDATAPPSRRHWSSRSDSEVDPQGSDVKPSGSTGPPSGRKPRRGQRSHLATRTRQNSLPTRAASRRAGPG